MIQETRLKGQGSFVLRLWLEPTDGGSPEWRWKVLHVQTGQERYFRSLAAVLEFVEGCTGVSPPQVSPSMAGEKRDRTSTGEQPGNLS